jgi:poly-gamma-glutamate capsule biosynthesis protein CapA/YwtB (metallophosphatase superfamily)
MLYGKRDTKQYFIRAFYIALGIVLVALIILFGSSRFGEKSSVFETAQQDSSEGEVRPKSITSRTMSFGEVFWGRYIDDAAQKSANRYEFPFKNLATFGRENYDAWIADLECPISNAEISSAVQDETLQLACKPEYVAQAAKWFNVFTLANNHMNDQGEAGYELTKTTLETQGIQYFGGFDPGKTPDICEVVALPARYTLSDGSFKSTKLPVAMCGLHHVFKLPDIAALEEIKKWSDVLPVWVYGHMGTEYTTEPSDIQQVTYRSFIDAGADVVIGTHPHRIQPAEAYKGRLIMYSLGNFIFDQWGAASQGGIEVQRGVGLGISITSQLDQSMLLWSQLASECKVYKDDCIDKSRTQGLNKPKYEYKYTIVTADNRENGAATLAGPDLTSDSLNRLNWMDTLLLLQSK